MSQSLLHQVTYSDKIIKTRKLPISRRLNPFYIRSRIPTPQKGMDSIETKTVSQSLLHQVTYSDKDEKIFILFCQKCLNPFYIRSRIPTLKDVVPTNFGQVVSIPFTSGHVFRLS